MMLIINSNGNKYIEKIKNDHLVLQGLINHVYLITRKNRIIAAIQCNNRRPKCKYLFSKR